LAMCTDIVGKELRINIVILFIGCS